MFKRPFLLLNPNSLYLLGCLHLQIRQPISLVARPYGQRSIIGHWLEVKDGDEHDDSINYVTIKEVQLENSLHLQSYDLNEVLKHKSSKISSLQTFP